MHMCVCYTVCACVRLYTHAKQKQRNESMAQSTWRHMDHIHTLKAIISTRRGPSTIEYGDGGSLIVHQAGICRYVCVSIHTHTN